MVTRERQTRGKAERLEPVSRPVIFVDLFLILLLLSFYYHYYLSLELLIELAEIVICYNIYSVELEASRVALFFIVAACGGKK